MRFDGHKPLPNAPAGPDFNPLYNYALVSPDGILHEDSAIQIGIQSHFFKHQGRLVLFYGNFTSSPITNLSVQIAPHTSIGVSLQKTPAGINPNKQEQQLVDVSCFSEFIEPPIMTVSYSVGGKPFSQTLKLPLVVVKFVQPHRVSEQEFLKLWPEMTTEQQQVIDTGAPANVQYAIQVFTEGFHLSVVPGTSWSVHNVVGAGIFYSASQALPVLIRMEVSPTTTLYRITVKTPSATLTTSVLAVLALIFGRPTKI